MDKNKIFTYFINNNFYIFDFINYIFFLIILTIINKNIL